MSKIAIQAEVKKEEAPKIEINRNMSRFWVDETKALDSSLRELGSGLVLRPELATKIKEALAKAKKA